MKINEVDLNEKDVRKMKEGLIWSEPQEDCLIWKGIKGRAEPTNQAYIGTGTNRVPVIRFIYTYYHGPIQEDHVIVHSCSNRVCVNPLHLCAATQRDRMLRTYSKADKSGGIRYSGVLRPKDVKNIRLMQLCYPTKDLALQLIEHYKVHKGTIYNILSGRTWKNITVTEEEKHAFLAKTRREE